VATLLILVHPRDLFRTRDFLIKGLVRPWESMGHTVLVHEGATRAPSADAVLLHVDRTVVPAEYLDVARAYRVAINGATGDISKRAISANLVGPFDAWRGPVIVKTDANGRGIPERIHHEVARRAGEVVGPPGRYMPERYPVFESIDHVPPELRLDPALVIEKFLPERDPRGYAARHWIFLGDRGVCTRLVGLNPMVKGADVVERSIVDLPDTIRAHGARLGFGYGKLDFVLHEGRAVLLDANRTPTLPAALRERVTYLPELAKGIDALLERGGT
jgi:hypothetical protein